MRRWFPALVLGVAVSCGRTPLDVLDDGAGDGGTLAPADASSETAPLPEGAPPNDASGAPNDVIEHHNASTRAGLYVQPTLTRALAAGLTRDPEFHALVNGDVYAQPLYVHDGPKGRGALYVVTEKNDVYALDEVTGAPAWHVNVGAPAAMIGVACGGGIKPLGITGTPYIDRPSRTIFFDAVHSDGASGIGTHMIHALSTDDGGERAGFPVDVKGLASNGATFDPIVQNQRGALALVRGTLFVPYGGHPGDCGAFRGWIVAVPIADPVHTHAWTPPQPGAGMWAPSGVSSDGARIFVATGNGETNGTWGGGEAILRLSLDLDWGGGAADYFAPSNWAALDARDADLGACGALLVDVPGALWTYAVALGKDGFAYVADRDNLGGIHDAGTQGLASKQVMTGDIEVAPATFTTSAGTFVTMHGQVGAQGTGCPAGQSGDLVTIQITGDNPPKITTAWCQDTQGHGSPIVTTTDGRAESIVWVASAETTNRLHGWNAETGELVYAGGADAEQMHDLQRFSTLIAVGGRIVVAGFGEVFAFRP